jgi:large subunit GTPase 1
MGRTGKAPSAMAKKGKDKNESSLGKALQRKQTQQIAQKRANARFDVDGSEARGKLVSVLDASSLEDFIASAMLSERDFESHKAHTVILDGATGEEMHIDADDRRVESKSKNNDEAHVFSFQQMGVPRRPAWSEGQTAADIDKQEKVAFMEWRREIASMEDAKEGAKVTPFEKNIEVWRQLWRVMEKSDLIIQIVDARNPLFYYSRDLLAYAGELSPPKPMVILVNKSDYLSAAQRREWAAYFLRQGWQGLFFSARASQVKLNRDARIERGLEMADGEEGQPAVDDAESDAENSDDSDSDSDESDSPQNGASPPPQSDNAAAADDDEAAVADSVRPPQPPSQQQQQQQQSSSSSADSSSNAAAAAAAAAAATGTAEEQAFAAEVRKRSKVLSREELTHVLEHMTRALGAGQLQVDKHQGRVCVGMVGYPNVGKSSVINVLVGATPFSHGLTRVSVGSTPGKTKHFQTLVLSDSLMLCDCPGLVFPSFVSSTAEMICAGCLPIMQMRDAMPPIALVARRVPRHILELTYTIAIRAPPDADLAEHGGKLRPPTAAELLEAVCTARGLYRPGAVGDLDTPRAARMLLKDYTEGKLLFCHAPPDLEHERTVQFLKETERTHLSSARLAVKLEAQHRKVADTAGADGSSSSAATADGEQLTALLRQRAAAIREKDAAALNGELTKAEQGFRRWGKKSKKFRDKTPYDEPAESLTAAVGADDSSQRRVVPSGAMVAGGKKASKKHLKHALNREGTFVRVTLPHHATYDGPVGRQEGI